MTAAVRIALVGEFGVGNIGNDVSATTMGSLLGSLIPDAEVSLVTRSAESAAELGWPVVPLGSRGGRGPFGRMLSKAGDLVLLLRTVRGFDLVLVPGTGMLEAATQRGPGGVITWLVLLGLACRVRRVPLVWFAIGGSRYAHPLPRRMAALAGRLANRRSFRDPVTRSELMAAGLRGHRDAVIPDVVFALPAAGAPRATAEAKRVLLSAIDWAGAGSGTRYTRELAEAVRRLREGGAEVVLAIADDADRGPTDAVVELLDPVPTIIGRDDFTGLLAAAYDADVVVSSRFHLLVAGLLAGRPVVALSHATKDDELLRWAGLGELIMPIRRIDADRLVGIIDQLLDDPTPIERRLDGPIGSARIEIVDELTAALRSAGLSIAKEVAL